MSYSVLIIEDEPVLARNIQLYLDRAGIQAQVAHSAEAGQAAVDEQRPDVVVLDHNLPGRDGLSLLQALRTQEPNLPVVMTTGHGSEQVAVDAMKAGAFDYLIKPVSLAQLRQVLDRAVEQQRRQQELAHLRRQSRDPSEGSGLDALRGESAAMRALKGRLQQIIDADLNLASAARPPTVLITGETGSGKELVARALHVGGPRRTGPFIELNCASLPSNLVESELFGHERGAFTDARERRIGLIEAAHGGTLFLDEIGELEPATQAKLLKLLEDRRIRRLGSVRELDVDVRVLAATHRPLETMVGSGAFRADLYFRLGIVRVDVPPLRDRVDDVVPLAQFFLQTLTGRYGKPGLRFSAAALERLAAHRWPGNVRELANTVEQCVILARGAEVSTADLPDAMGRAPERPVPAASGVGTLSLPETERHLVSSALDQHQWNVTQAARTLGISRDTLRYRIEKWGLERPRDLPD